MPGSDSAAGLSPQDSARLLQLAGIHARLAHDRPGLNREVKALLAGLDPACLPLQQGLQHSSVALAADIAFSLLGVEQTDNRLCFHVAVFYQGIVAGCSCADDPTPQDTVAEYCELEIRLHRKLSEVSIRLV